MIERHGIEADCCPKCMGIWFDRYKMENIVKRIMAPSLNSPSARASGVHAAIRWVAKLPEKAYIKRRAKKPGALMRQSLSLNQDAQWQ
jgi:Zn-finger nucleic acid-binding protein